MLTWERDRWWDVRVHVLMDDAAQDVMLTLSHPCCILQSSGNGPGNSPNQENKMKKTQDELHAARLLRLRRANLARPAHAAWRLLARIDGHPETDPTTAESIRWRGAMATTHILHLSAGTCSTEEQELAAEAAREELDQVEWEIRKEVFQEYIDHEEFRRINTVAEAKRQARWAKQAKADRAARAKIKAELARDRPDGPDADALLSRVAMATGGTKVVL